MQSIEQAVAQMSIDNKKEMKKIETMMKVKKAQQFVTEYRKTWLANKEKKAKDVLSAYSTALQWGVNENVPIGGGPYMQPTPMLVTYPFPNDQVRLFVPGLVKTKTVVMFVGNLGNVTVTFRFKLSTGRVLRVIFRDAAPHPTEGLIKMTMLVFPAGTIDLVVSMNVHVLYPKSRFCSKTFLAQHVPL
jgi:hypothetical protein